MIILDLLFKEFAPYQGDAIMNELQRYKEPHRYYHTWEHIEKLLISGHKKNILTEQLFWAILFHDIVYDPLRSDNEEQSAELFKRSYKGDHTDEIYQAIIDTKKHSITKGNFTSKHLCELDLEILSESFEDFIDFEHKIFKEYQFADYKTYIEKRVEILKDLGVRPEFITYVETRKPNIAVYAGSFNPFHKGHFNVLQKAEKIFDKVIIARGINPDKAASSSHLPGILKYHQCENYQGLLTDFIDGLGYEITLIRGLRNAADLDYEKTQAKFLKDMKPDIKIVNIICDAEYEHISSSAIRQLDKLNVNTEKYLVK